MGNSSSDRPHDADIDLNGVNSKVCILRKRLGLSSRLLSPFQVDVGQDQATGPLFCEGQAAGSANTARCTIC